MRTKVMLSNVSKQTAEPLCRRVTLTFACYRIFFFAQTKLAHLALVIYQEMNQFNV